jgi:hypothetical protein
MVFLTTLISVALYHGFVQAQTHKVSITCRAAGDRHAGVGNDHLGPLDQGESGVRPPRCAGDPARANRFIDENRAETIKVLLQWVKQTPEIAGRSYDVELKSILRDGTMTDGEMESFIDRLGNEKKRSIDEVREFSFVRQAWKELETGK